MSCVLPNMVVLYGATRWQCRLIHTGFLWFVAYSISWHHCHLLCTNVKQSNQKWAGFNSTAVFSDSEKIDYVIRIKFKCPFQNLHYIGLLCGTNSSCWDPDILVIHSDWHTDTKHSNLVNHTCLTCDNKPPLILAGAQMCLRDTRTNFIGSCMSSNHACTSVYHIWVFYVCRWPIKT